MISFRRAKKASTIAGSNCVPRPSSSQGDSFGHFQDWRLPDIDDLRSLFGMGADELGFADGQAVDDLLSKAAMLLHDFVFFRSEFAGLQQNGIGNSDLADVVQLRGRLENLELRFRESELFSDDAGVASDPDDVLT